MPSYSKLDTITPDDNDGIDVDGLHIKRNGEGPAVVKLALRTFSPDSEAPVTISTDLADLFLPLRVAKVFATGTSGADIYGWRA